MPGREDRVRALIHDDVKDHCHSIQTDPLSNLICFKAAKKTGDQDAQRMMVACHMDELAVDYRGRIPCRPLP